MKRDAKPGTLLKNLRIERGWKLSDLAARTGLRVSTLSKMENGKVALSYDKLAQISKALDVDVGSFFGPARGAPPSSPGGTGRRSIIRGGEGQVIETEAYHHLYHATELLNKRFIPMIAYSHVKSMAEFGDWMRHAGEEYTYILEGTLDFYSELYAPVRLEQGDAIYFDSGMGHAYIAVGDEPCRTLTICAGDAAQAAPELDQAPPRPNDAVPATIEPLPAPARARVIRGGGASKPAAAAKSTLKARTGS